MFITKKSISRRTALRGMGVTLALPLLDAMTPAFKAQSKGAAAALPRMGFFYTPNGVTLSHYLPKTTGADFEITPILKPLESVRDQMVIVTGLANSQADPLDLGSGPHTRCQAVWLNGCRTKRTEGADVRAGTTIDQLAAQELGKETPLVSLELALEPNFTVGNCEGGYSCTYINTFSWRTPTMPLPMETNPHAVFERLFGDGGNAAARRAQMRKYQSILDSVRDDIARLEGKLGPQDRTVVGEYLEAVRDVERRIQKIERSALNSPLEFEKPLGIPDSFDEHAKLMFDLTFLAYQADITRMVSFQIAREMSTRSYPELGVPEAHHDISHHGDTPEKMAKNTKINTYHMALFAQLVEKMRNTRDGDGSLLDHSMLMWGSSMGDGSRHVPRELPTVLVGNGYGRLKTGRHIRAAVDTPMMNFGLSLLDKIGVELESVGDSTGRLADL